MAHKDAGKNMSGSSDEPKIYINDDTQKRTPPWVIRDYQEKGALTDEAKAKIAKQFDLKPELVEELSILVGNSLDEESVVSLAKVTREKAVLRARSRLEDAARLARRMSFDHASVERHLSRLQTYFDDSETAAPLLAALQDELDGIQTILDSLEARINELARIEHGVAEIKPDDKRSASDKRREHVVRSCCYIWEDAGRKVSYTTVSRVKVGTERRGRLVNLINTVARVVTNPPTELPGESIRHDIDRFKKLRNRGDI
jgi:hypothetical protein